MVAEVEAYVFHAIYSTKHADSFQGGRGRGRGGGRGGRGGGYSNNGRSDWKDIEKKNEHFEKYYNELNIVPEEEREVFWSALKKELPNSFRFTGSKG